MFEKLAEDIYQATIEKLARRNRRVKGILRDMGFADGSQTGGLFSHSFGGTYGEDMNKVIPLDDIIEHFRKIQGPDGRGVLKTPVELAANNIPFTPESDTSVLKRISVNNGSQVQFPADTVIDSEGRVTTPLINRSGTMGSGKVPSNKAIARMLGSSVYGHSSADFTNDYQALPKVVGAGNSPWSVSATSSPDHNRIYGEVGFLMPASSAEGKIKISDSSTKNTAMDGHEYRMYPKFNSDGTITAARWNNGVPYYIIPDKQPGQEVIDRIRRLKKEVPGIRGIRIRDIEAINKRVKNNQAMNMEVNPKMNVYGRLPANVKSRGNTVIKQEVTNARNMPLYKTLTNQANTVNRFGWNPKFRVAPKGLGWRIPFRR